MDPPVVLDAPCGVGQSVITPFHSTNCAILHNRSPQATEPQTFSADFWAEAGMSAEMEDRLACCSLGFHKRVPFCTISLRFRSSQRSPQPVRVSFVDSNTGGVSDAVEFSDLRKGKTERGNIKRLDIRCRWRDHSFFPGAVLVTATEADEPMSLFLVSVTFNKGFRRFGLSLPFPCFSWISSDQGQRVFFFGLPWLPSQTPPAIKELRDAELAQLRSEDTGERRGSERIYQYDVYNDLSNVVPTDERAPWGGTAERPYPRRLRTGRALNPGGNSESRPRDPVSGQLLNFWVPDDDDFIPEKLLGFGTLIQTNAVRNQTAVGLFGGPSGGFPDVESVARLYTSEPQGPGFPVPRAFEGREDAWKSDVEFGRQRIAGYHPNTIEGITSLPKTSAITDVLVKPILLDGATLDERLEQGRMYMVDYTPLYIDLLDSINGQAGPLPRFQYAPRCLLYSNDSKELVPVAIELSTTSGSDVFTPSSSLTQWTLAKAHFLAADLIVHEGYTHFTRAHASTEPYIIAARRHLSSMHPVFRLLMPHFADTLRINAAGRQTLIDSPGTLESLTTVGSFLGDLVTSAYAKLWRFISEGLPGDLLKRNMATAPAGADWRAGELNLVLEEYPYAQDGLLIWKSLHAWVAGYLDLYYKSPEDVAEDSELQAWWEEIKTNGHPDLVKFGIATEDEVWPPMQTIEELTFILVTMIWITSAHHAAINFGQYDYIGYFPYAPNYMLAPMPTPAAISTPDDVLDETLYLRSLSPPVIASGIASLFNTLSTAGEGDVFLGMEIPFWFGDTRVRKVFRYFSRRILRDQKVMNQRNRQFQEPSRSFPYTLLLPHLGPRDKLPTLAFRGIPNNVGE